MRKCVICGQEKEDCAFIHDKYAKDGIRNVCRECNKKRAQKRRNNYKQHLENLENKLKEYEITILKENKKLKELLKEYKKQLSEIKNAYIDLTTQDEYGSYYIDEAKFFVEIVGKIIKDFKTENE